MKRFDAKEPKSRIQDPKKKTQEPKTRAKKKQKQNRDI